MAAAAPNNRQTRDTVEFPPNVPVTVSLKYSEPRMVSGQYGERAMFSTTDNRALFLDPPVAAQIVQLAINVREPFTITRRVSGIKGAPATWEVSRPVVSGVGEQGDGTFAVPAAAQPAAPATAAAPASAAPVAKPVQRAATATGLIDEANALVDAYAQVLERALTTYGGRVKPDEVRALLISSYIQRQKLSSVA